MKTMIAILFLNLTACTSAGPFVTNLEKNADGSITYEECYVRLNAFLGIISNHSCHPGRISNQ